MVTAIITILIGWFVYEKVPTLVSARGTLATIIKLVGIVICIAGFVDLAHALF